LPQLKAQVKRKENREMDPPQVYIPPNPYKEKIMNLGKKITNNEYGRNGRNHLIDKLIQNKQK